MTSFSKYKNPSVATDVIVFGYEAGKLSVLLLKRSEEPFKDRWTLPGVFVQIEETLEQACTRLLATKLGMAKVYLEQLYTFDEPGRDPRGRVISVAYYALVNPAKLKTTAGKMAGDVQWHDAEKLPSLGFDHKHIYTQAIQRLRSKIVYFPVGFELLDDVFTMPELHELYECILCTTIDRRNFRRKLLASGYIVATGSKTEGMQNRPADLYRFNKKLKQNNFQLNIS